MAKSSAGSSRSPRRSAHIPALLAILATCHRLFERLTPAPLQPDFWHVEIHQFRIEAHAGQEGQPTPEGMHRDGVDWVLVLLVNRVNISEGETSIGDWRNARSAASP